MVRSRRAAPAIVSLAAAALAGCTSASGSVDCDTASHCVVVLERHADAGVVVLDEDLFFVAADTTTATVQIGDRRATVARGAQAAELAGLRVQLTDVTDDEVTLAVTRP